MTHAPPATTPVVLRKSAMPPARSYPDAGTPDGASLATIDAPARQVVTGTA
jgi:hypothetical protein